MNTMLQNRQIWNYLFLMNIMPLLLLFTLPCFAQQQSFDVSKMYQQHLMSSLNPDNGSTPILLFIISPNKDADRTLRIIDRDGRYYVEVRNADKNIWTELLANLKEHKNARIQINVSCVESQISKAFRDKLQKLFTCILSEGVTNTQHVMGTYDGTVYQFNMYQNSTCRSTKINFDLDHSDLRYKAIEVLIRIICDINQGTFKEIKYQNLN